MTNIMVTVKNLKIEATRKLRNKELKLELNGDNFEVDIFLRRGRSEF